MRPLPATVYVEQTDGKNEQEQTELGSPWRANGGDELWSGVYNIEVRVPGAADRYFPGVLCP